MPFVCALGVDGVPEPDLGFLPACGFHAAADRAAECVTGPRVSYGVQRRRKFRAALSICSILTCCTWRLLHFTPAGRHQAGCRRVVAAILHNSWSTVSLYRVAKQTHPCVSFAFQTLGAAKGLFKTGCMQQRTCRIRLLLEVSHRLPSVLLPSSSGLPVLMLLS